MHGTSAGSPAPLSTFGGLVTLASPDSLPEGASPRLWDIDFLVGSAQTRDGLTSVYSFGNSFIGPNAALSAVDVSTSGNPWQNPRNILIKDGNFAKAMQSSTSTASATLGSGVTSGSGARWMNPGNATSTSAVTTVTLTTGGTGSVSASPFSANVQAISGENGVSVSTTQDFIFPGGGTATSLTLELSGTFDNTYVGSSIGVELSIDGGASFTGLYFNDADFGTQILTQSGSFDLTQVIFRVTSIAMMAPEGTPPATTTANVSSVSAEATYPPQLATQLLSVPVAYAGAPPTMVTLSFDSLYAGTAATVVVNGMSHPLTSSSANYSVNLASLPSTVSITGSSTGNSVISLNNLKITVAYASGGVDSLDVTEFGFDLPSTTGITGITVNLTGFSNSSVQLSMQILKGGIPNGDIRTITMPNSLSTVTFGGGSDAWGTGLLYSDANNTSFGVRISVSSGFSLASTFLDFIAIQINTTEANTNFNYIGTFVAQNKAVKNIALDADGNLWVEDVTNNPGVLNLATEGIAPNSFANSVNGPDVEYLAFNDLFSGSDIPRQYTPNWIDKITQVGPGAAPVFEASQASSNSFAIATIDQPAAYKTNAFAFGLQSAGPGSTQPGNVITQYYEDSTAVPHGDTDLIAQFNAGNPVYVYLNLTPSSGGDTVGSLTSPYVALVTSVGLGKPPGQARNFYYFTYQATSVAFVWNPGQLGYLITYQRSLATLTTSVPVPQLSVGEKVLVTANSVTAYNATWPISQALNSGAMAITQSSLDSSGVATYSYTVLSGASPSAGQLVTVTGTLNADGNLNVVNTAIASVTGGSFTVDLLAGGTTFPPVAEEAQAVTAGTVFAFDPGVADLGTGTSPIFGDGTGGSLTITGSGQFISAGTKQGSVFFITRNGAWTFPAPPVTFTVPANTTAILASHIPIGPPNVIGRGIILTESGQDGVPGGNFFTIPTPVNYTVANVKYSATSLLINDNTSTTATFSFTDAVLLNAEAVDVQGNNLFNLIEIGNPGWIVKYDSRNFYGLCLNKIQNFINLSFDGGYLPRNQLVPLGWTNPDAYGQLLNSPVFGNSYYIKNTSGSMQDTLGLISQTAYEDAYQQPIINANTAYSVRVTARIPSSLPTGNLIVSLTADGTVYGSFTLPFSAMSSTMATYTGTLYADKFTTVPSGLMLNVYASAIGEGADVEIDRIEPFDTAIPVLATSVFGSYPNLPESVDAVTGVVKFISENQQPVNGAVVMYDTFYGLKESSMYSLQAVPNLEPAQWGEPEVAQRAGACGVNAYDFGEQWIVEACRNGIYLYEGGLPGKITQEIFQVWDAINWSQKQCIWVKNDVKKRRLFVGVPLPTPNFWLPNAPVNLNPTSPNVILMLNYQGLDSGEAIKSSPQVHTTMFGNLDAMDMRRKWSIWNIASPYGSFVTTATDEEFYICNGDDSSKIYMLDPTSTTDDGTPINSLYTTYGFVNSSKAQQFPMLGMFRKLWGYMTMTVSGVGNLKVRFLPNQLLGPEDSTLGYRSWEVPGGFNLSPVCLNDREASLNFAATRTYVELSGTDFNVSALTLKGKQDTWNQFTGKK